MTRRVVGYLEYENALENLEKLASLANSEDMKAIDAIIGDRDEFAIFRELPPGFDGNEESLGNVSQTGETGADADLQGAKRGLAWVLALARVEFGAVVAGFTEHPDPYQFVKPESYAYSETMQLLLEGVVGHYMAMKNELSLEALAKESFKQEDIKGALTVSRRLRIARSMLRPLMKPERSRYTNDQANQLENSARDLDQAQAAVFSVITRFLSRTSTAHYDRTISREFVEACGMQLAAEKREIEAGTAQITRFPGEGSRQFGTGR